MEFLVCVDGVWAIAKNKNEVLRIKCSGEVQAHTLEQISSIYVPDNLWEAFSFGFGLIAFGWAIGFFVKHVFDVIRSTPK